MNENQGKITDEHEQLKKVQLMIAEDIKRICEKYQIKYFLDAGSMLGAVRHKGFIPWDDDIDIGMPKEDYNKFLEVAPAELGEKYFVDNYNTNHDNPLVFTKIRLLGTEYIENKANAGAKHNEIFVDIFPYYYISDNELVRKSEAFRMQLLTQMLLIKGGYKVWRGETRLKYLKFLPIQILAKCYSVKTLRNRIDKLYNKHKGTKNICVHAGSCYNYWYFPAIWFDEMIMVDFEGVSFSIPKEYDAFLTKAYGDYRKLPPEKDRQTHQIMKLELGKYTM